MRSNQPSAVYRVGETARLECSIDVNGVDYLRPSLNWYDGTTLLLGEERESGNTLSYVTEVPILESAYDGKEFICKLNFTKEHVSIPRELITAKSISITVICKYSTNPFNVCHLGDCSYVKCS